MADSTDVRIRPRASDAQWLLHAEPGDAAAIAAATGLALGEEMLRASQADGWHALHLSPDEWLLVGDRSGDPLDVRFATVTVPHALVGVSDRSTGREITGARAIDVLAGGCALDLERLPDGTCTRTLFGRITVMLWRRGDTWRIDYPRSYDGYITALLAAIVDTDGLATA